MNSIEEASTYFLILELLDGGEIGLLPDIEPIPSEAILSELRRRTAVDFGDDKKDWARWFMRDKEFGSEIERANVAIFLDTQSTMLRILNDRKIGE